MLLSRACAFFCNGRIKKRPFDIRTFAGPVDIDTANSIVAEGKPIWGWTTFPDKNKVGD